MSGLLSPSARRARARSGPEGLLVNPGWDWAGSQGGSGGRRAYSWGSGRDDLNPGPHCLSPGLSQTCTAMGPTCPTPGLQWVATWYRIPLGPTDGPGAGSSPAGPTGGLCTAWSLEAGGSAFPGGRLSFTAKN